MQELLDWRTFDTTWLWVIPVDTLKLLINSSDYSPATLLLMMHFFILDLV